MSRYHTPRERKKREELRKKLKRKNTVIPETPIVPEKPKKKRKHFTSGELDYFLVGAAVVAGITVAFVFFFL